MALTVACVDGFRDRFGVGPAGGAPAGPPGCGLYAMRLTGPDLDTRQPHGRRARGAGPRHPRGPCRFLHGRVRVPQDAHPVVGAGRDPAGIGRGWVMDIMREPGVRGVRRGGTSVTARPAKGRGRRARPRGTRVREAGRPGPAARGRHRLRARHGQRTLRLHGARPPTCSPTLSNKP